jgi:LacI family sucrose operon transcriptional repressor
VVRTIDELARLSGVSRATVSRVINGGSVSDKTRRRVEHIVAETGYRPNLAARTLASGRSGVVGVVMHIDPHLLFRDA